MLTQIKTQFDLQDEFLMRPATMADLATAVDLFNLCSQAQIGADEFTVAALNGNRLGSIWKIPPAPS